MKQNHELRELSSINVSFSSSVSQDSWVREITLDDTFVADALRGELNWPLASYGEIKIDLNPSKYRVSNGVLISVVFQRLMLFYNMVYKLTQPVWLLHVF